MCHLSFSLSVGRISKKIVVVFRDVWRTDSLCRFHLWSPKIDVCSVPTVLTNRAESAKDVQVTCHFIAG